MFRTLTPWREAQATWPEGFSRTLARIDDEFEEFLARMFPAAEGPATPARNWFVPRVDLTETEDRFQVKVDLPGLKPEEVKVELRNGDLWITGERKEEHETKDKTYHRVERRQGQFRRVLPLPHEAAKEAIDAKVENGVLTVTVPKAESAPAQRIEVQG